ncbi:MAG: D-tyrosyl-tRNA(Tyr) deacylase [Erysipelotrichia bacterium]|nr:D-tyrosyl-tRNA(Tyr) deacylase [Erysipelotrichia bacterium]
MKIVLTTVSEASVIIDGHIHSSIKRGFCLLVGFTHSDNQAIIDKMIDKVLALRVFMDEKGLTNLSIHDVKGQIMSVSQFTLYADLSKGRRPSFTKAMPQAQAEALYAYFNTKLLEKFGPIATGIFGADMKINSTNEGPFTVILDSEELFK